MMSCDQVRTTFLDHDWSRADLDEAAILVEHLKQCPACSQTVAQYEELRRLLRSPEPAASLPTVESFKANRAIAPRRGLQRFVAAALAASLLVGVVGWTLYLLQRLDTSSQPLVQSTSPTSTNCWTQADIDREVQVFSNVSETFDGRTSWVVLGDRAAEMGLMSAPSIDHRKLLLLRLVVRRDGGEEAKTDLVIVAGQDATFSVPVGDGQVLRYTIGTTADKDRLLSIWAELQSPGGQGETVAAVATQIKPRSGDTLGAGRLVTPSGSFNLQVSSHEQDLAKL